MDWLAMFWDDGLLYEMTEDRMRGKQTRGRRFQSPHDLANDGGYVALKQAAEDRQGWSLESQKGCHKPSDVNKDWTCKDKDKDKDQAYKDKDKDLNLVLKDKDKNFTYSYLLQVAAKPTIAIKQQQWTQSENSQLMTVKPITLNK